jgi:hypothetical protein
MVDGPHAGRVRRSIVFVSLCYLFNRLNHGVKPVEYSANNNWTLDRETSEESQMTHTVGRASFVTARLSLVVRCYMCDDSRSPSCHKSILRKIGHPRGGQSSISC